MPQPEEMRLLLLIISLSLAVQAVRRQFIGDNPAPKNYFRWLLLADVPLVIAGILLIVYLHIKYICNTPPFFISLIILIDVAIATLIGFIFNEWIKTAKR